MSDSKGSWKSVGCSGVVGTHAALLHTGKVLFFTRPEAPSHRHNTAVVNGLPGDNLRPNDVPDITLSTIFELSGCNAFKPVAVHVNYNPFCSGHTFLADGRLFVAGGDKKRNISINDRDAGVPENTRNGLYSVRAFTPDDSGMGKWETIDSLQGSRWYPTCTLLPDGRVFIVSGSIDDQQNYNNQNPTCEIYPSGTSISQYLHLLVEAWPYHSYPFVFVLPSGELFLFAKDSGYYLRLEKDKFEKERWHVTNGQKLTRKAEPEPAKLYPNSATSVLLPLLPEEGYAAKVLLIGGAGANIYPAWPTHNKIPELGSLDTYEVEALRCCFALDVYPFKSDAVWQPVEPMANPRVMPDAVLLPDGTVMVVNGVTRGFAGGNASTGPMLAEYAAKEAELYDPVKNTWSTLATAGCPRLYHSTALLLPDATVLVAGSDHQIQNEFTRRPQHLQHVTPDEWQALTYEFEVEVFSPPYLFKGTRPKIIEAPEQMAYGQPFEIKVDKLGDLTTLKKGEVCAALLRPGSVTHNNNMSQRHIGLTIDWEKRTATHLTLSAPPDNCIAPPGYYMLFLLFNGVPSVAHFVQLPLNTANTTADTNSINESNNDTATVPGYKPSEMVLWLQAKDVELHDDDSSYGKNYEDGAYGIGAVKSWPDSSGYKNNLVCPPENTEKKSYGGKPKYRPPKKLENELNGYPVVRFTLVDNGGTQWGGYLESTKPFLGNEDPYYVFLVTHPWPSGNTGAEGRGTPGLVSWGDITFRLGPGPRSTTPKDFKSPVPPKGGFTNHLPAEPGKVSLITSWGKKQIGDDNDATVSFPKAVLLESSFDGEIRQMQYNGEIVRSIDKEVNGTNISKGHLVIGRNPVALAGYNYGDFFRGDIAEVLIYNRTIEEEERKEIQEYLRSKYALW